jgi:high affinity Mn2+ porin
MMRKQIFLGLALLPLMQAVKAQQADSMRSTSSNWTTHFQLTVVSQNHPSFKAAYSGPNSLVDTAETGITSVTTTLFIGRKLWKGAAFYFNPELAGGSGLSKATGVAGFPNGETFRIGSPAPALYVARAYLQQHIALGNAHDQPVSDDVNQLGGYVPDSRITLSAGKFALSDFFDDNLYSHDPRSQFLNWSLMSNGAWDYPANTRGYTVGLVAELVQPGWALRASVVQVPAKANGPKLDSKIGKASGETVEFEKSYSIHHLPGTVRLLGFYNTSRAPGYKDAIAKAAMGDSSSADVISGAVQGDRFGGRKFGWGISLNQDIAENIGGFFRASWNDGKTATWAFTEIDKSISSGLHFNGRMWKRPNDHFGAAFVINGLSRDHRDYLRAGLHGFILGDGQLNYGSEGIIECYYAAQVFPHMFLSGDYQFVNHPGYNKDRGPVHVFALRGHIEF